MGGAIPSTDPVLVESSFIDGAMSRGWYMSAADPFNPESGCAWDGMSTPCRNLGSIIRYTGLGYIQRRYQGAEGGTFGISISGYITRRRGHLKNNVPLEEMAGGETEDKPEVVRINAADARDVVTITDVTFFGGGNDFAQSQSRSRIRNVDSVMNKIRWIGDNVTKAELKSQYQDRILHLLSAACAAAFKSAGLPTPEDVINGGLTIAAHPLLNDPVNNGVLGISEDIRREAVKNEAPAQTIPSRYTTKGAIILFRAEALLDQAYLNEALAHEFMHGAIGTSQKFPLWGYSLFGRGTDLSGHPHYKDIIDSCGYQTVSR